MMILSTFQVRLILIHASRWISLWATCWFRHYDLPNQAHSIDKGKRTTPKKLMLKTGLYGQKLTWKIWIIKLGSKRGLT